ncbi:hypothetical protein A4A49_52163 [Nicotiana attenuata]|uniref:Uncharacterized protein n=1 Tax=Nicotiana attenuata TaxID=49451 RepID=A0A314L8H9_NICAT|nr:hypothetical protein A4A49_52163 [Nicotiana attenuata]
MTRGRGTKRSWGGRGSISNKGGGGYHSYRTLLRQILLAHTSQNVPTQPTNSASLNIGRQQAPPSSQNVGPQQETPQDVSTEQTLASYGSSNPQARRDTICGIRSLKVNGDTFCPHEAVRDVTIAFKKSFSGSWNCWSKVSEHVRDRWFNDFESTFTEIIKDKVGETSTSRNEEGFEIDDDDIDRNMATNEDEEGEKTSEDNVVDLLKSIPDEQLLKAWIEIVGGAKKGRIYGLGPKTCLLADSVKANCAYSSAPNPPNIPTQQVFESPEFQQLLNRALDQRMENMHADMQAGIREDMREEVKVAARAVVREMLGLTQPPPNGSGSSPNIS